MDYLKKKKWAALAAAIMILLFAVLLFMWNGRNGLWYMAAGHSSLILENAKGGEEYQIFQLLTGDTAPVYECDNCGLHFSDKEDAEAHVNGACRNAAVLRATQLVRDADGNVVNELWYACSGLNGLGFASGRFWFFFRRKISPPHML